MGFPWSAHLQKENYISHVSAKLIDNSGKTLAVIAAVILLGKPHEVVAGEVLSDNIYTAELDSSSSAFDSIVLEDDPDDKPPPAE
jgi:hypothetical protein